MTIQENTQGVGKLAGVLWTPFGGAGLDSQDRDAVQRDIDTARYVADSLLDSVKSAINRGASFFSLDDLQSLGELGTLPTGGNTAADWASFIGHALDNHQQAGELANLNAWQRIASDLQRYAARQSSLFDPGGGVAPGGGVSHANGQWYANGQALSLLDLFTAVRVNQIANYDDTIDGYMGEMQANQRKLNAARAWGEVLRGQMPPYTSSNGDSTTPKAALSQTQVNAFIHDWGIDPIANFTPAAKPYVDQEPQRATVWQGWLTQLKSFVDRTDTDNQSLKGRIDQKYNRRSEVLEAMGSFDSKESDTGSNMAASLA